MDQQQYPEIWPGWETVRLIGQGSYGAVYEIRRQLGPLEERAAVKWLSIPRNPGDIKELRASGFDQAALIQRFSAQKDKLVLEYTTMARLKGSTNVVYCDDIRTQRQANGLGWDVYIKMELLTPLLDVLDSSMDEKQILSLGQDIAQALASCHREKVLHRDVKPQNIFVNREGRYKLGDFGVAKTIEGTGNASVRTGTYGYMAPEVFNGEHYGPKADLYSLGLVLYWLLNERRLPFLPLPPQTLTSEEETQARTRRFRGEPLPPPAHGSSGMKSIVMKACAYDPRDRYESAWHILDDMERLRTGKPVSAPPVSDYAGPGRELDDGSATHGVFDSEMYSRRRQDSRQGQQRQQSDRQEQQGSWQNQQRQQSDRQDQQGGWQNQQRQQSNRQDQQGSWQNQQRQQSNRQDQQGSWQNQQRQQSNRQDQQGSWQNQQRQQSNRQDQQGSWQNQQRQQSNRQEQQGSWQNQQRQQSNRQDQQGNWQGQQRQQSNRQEQQRQQSNRKDKRQQSNRQSGKGFWGWSSERKQESSRKQQNLSDGQQWADYYQSTSFDGNMDPYWGDNGPADYSGGQGQDPFWGDPGGNMNYDVPGGDDFWGADAGPESGLYDYGDVYGDQNDGDPWGVLDLPDDLDY